MHLIAGRAFFNFIPVFAELYCSQNDILYWIKIVYSMYFPRPSLSIPPTSPTILSLSHRWRIREVVLNRRLFLTLQAWLIDLHPCHSTVSPSYLRIMMCYLPKPRCRPRQIYSETQYQINNRQLHFLWATFEQEEVGGQISRCIKKSVLSVTLCVK